MAMPTQPQPTTPAPSLNDNQRKLYDVMKKIGAVDAEHAKTAEDIVKVGKFPKGQMLAWLQELEKLGYAKRKVGNKAAHYHLTR
jgi:hypothetical protein